jgi:hypothetical protein
MPEVLAFRRPQALEEIAKGSGADDIVQGKAAEVDIEGSIDRTTSSSSTKDRSSTFSQ